MTTRRRWARAGTVAVAVLLLAGCASGPGTVAGTWGDDERGEPLLLLGEDGSLSGTDGCNRLSGSWVLAEDGTVDFGDVAATLMACPGVDTWLSGLATAQVRGGRLHVFDGAGDEIGTLPRERETDLR